MTKLRLVDSAAQKQQIREAVWRLLDARGISTFPRPVRGRIPNVRDADLAASLFGFWLLDPARIDPRRYFEARPCHPEPTLFA